jgi:hypothetical protein
LGSLLTGRALNIYTTLPDEVINNYQALKKALLLGFNKTPDMIRLEFRGMKRNSDETFAQFYAQLGRVFKLWLESREVDMASADSLMQFILEDQLLASLPIDVRTFVKEQNCSNPSDMVSAADTYAMAHRNQAKPKPPKIILASQGVSPVPNKFNSHNNNNDYHLKQSTSTRAKRDWSNLRCHYCSELGHPQFMCPKRPSQPVTSKFPHERVNFSFEDNTPQKYSSYGSINGTRVSSIWRDTGCSCVIVAEQVLPNLDVENCRKINISDYLGNSKCFPVVRCYLKCDFYNGFVDAVRAPIKFCSVLVGNIPGVKDLKITGVSTNEHNLPVSNPSLPNHKVAVVTRSQKTKAIHPLKLPKLDVANITSEEFKSLQHNCTSINDIRKKVISEEIIIVKNRSYTFVEHDGLIYNKCVNSKFVNEVDKLTLVIPSECRNTVLVTGHESPLSGHFSARKTEIKIRDQFYWPRMGTDIRDFCRSCDICQRMSIKGRTRKAPMIKMPIISEPFYRVSIDLVGPLSPPSSEGHRYILTLIDVATSFPEAVPLKNIDTISVSEALLEIFSRVGIPKEIHSDLGRQFVSDLMKELHRLLGIQPIFNTPYHPMGTGRIERMHLTLKSVLRKLCAQKPTHWHRYLIPTLFALRELPSDRTGYSAFELLYGRQVRGPIAVLRSLWDSPDLSVDQRTTYQYVLDLKNKLHDCSIIAAEQADISGTKYKQYFDLKSQDRKFEVDDEVLVLLPDCHNKLLMSWRGPFKVLEKKNKVNYLIDDNGSKRLYHTNLLKRYHRRTSAQFVTCVDEVNNPIITSTPFCIAQNCVISDENVGLDESEEIITVDPLSDGVLNEVEVSSELPSVYKNRIVDFIKAHEDVLSNTPGCTSAACHEIRLNCKDPVRSKVYPIPIHLREFFEAEVDNLISLGIIRPSMSPYCSPCLMIKKSDGTYRLAIDYRGLNAVTLFDAEPSCNVEEELHKFHSSQFFTELDLCKAYYQLPLAEQSIPLTAFATHKGLMEFTRMPFGLVTACSSYIRLMRLVLADLPHVSFYFDNILVHTESLDEHLEALRSVFDRLRKYNLTLKPSKCKFALRNVEYLGFEIGEGVIKPLNNKISAITEIPLPRTKTQLRSFLGMCMFYAKFIPNASEICAPLTDLLKKVSREPLVWSDHGLANFEKLKLTLASAPILKLPNLEKAFVLRTDASQTGIGGVLLQYYDDIPHPVAYVSRKLLQREVNYSVIERELLAIIFGVSKFRYYLLGKQFMLEVDHRPLVYLNKFKGQNDRLLRWALSLQPYNFRIVYIPGKDNLGADMLSRL